MSLKHPLPPIAIARLAALSVSRAALAELIDIELLDSPTYIGPDPRASFVPTAKLLKAAADGIASLVLENTPAAAGDVRANVREKLVKLGLTEESADAVVGQLVARKTLSTIHQSPADQFALVTNVLNALNYKSGVL